MKRRKKDMLKDIFFKQNGGLLLQQQMSSGDNSNIEKTKLFTSNELEKATDHFNENRILGQGGQGTVHKGMLTDGNIVANGTLYDYIHDRKEYVPLTWEIRLRIATEIGAKVADFGTSRTIVDDQTHLTTKVHGTFGYLDPEYFQSSQLTEKSDVYSFGVVLVELLTGQKPITAFSDGETCSLATYFLSAMEENRLFEIVDHRVMIESGKDQVKRFAELASGCLNLDGRKRPKMKQVAIELELIRTSDEAATTDEVEYNSVEHAAIWETMSTGIESGPVTTSSASDFHPLLL
ncbi:putative protein kinase RLK-Pelle-WAK family [Helianthus annuus]|uniref:Protein kinase domain-containing protein n=2 Tax=Helianthus annuus TaxID=4232 RepID=A0A9K3JSA1_HELAN|nr:putative protein kinase RLK-Pelle-WAK family [Helianthus annuus]KAJ0946166.1 putative protein kinase RLK-Pelle-WAK family [Helianthus annuus]